MTKKSLITLFLLSLALINISLVYFGKPSSISLYIFSFAFSVLIAGGFWCFFEVLRRIDHPVFKEFTLFFNRSNIQKPKTSLFFVIIIVGFIACCACIPNMIWNLFH